MNNLKGIIKDALTSLSQIRKVDGLSVVKWDSHKHLTLSAEMLGGRCL